ncbi:24759_t:CDS:2, partial [Racocetra persica]
LDNNKTFHVFKTYDKSDIAIYRSNHRIISRTINTLLISNIADDFNENTFSEFNNMNNKNYFAENALFEFNDMNNELLVFNEVSYLTEVTELNIVEAIEGNKDATETIKGAKDITKAIEDNEDDSKKILYPITLNIVFTNWKELDG